MRSLTAFTSLSVSFILSFLISQTTAFDYEPGDTLNRLFCYCTADPANNDQSDWDPFTFLTTTDDRRMSFIYNFEYYNHRMNQRMVLEYEGQCSSYEVGEYTRNKCLIWEEQNFKCCGQFQLAPDPALGKFDHGLGEHPWKNWGDGYPVPGHQDLKYEFCYGFEGDNLEGKARDWFRFDSGQRHLPRPHDSVAPREEVEAKCEKMCIEKHGMWMFRPKFGVEQFNRGDGFHHFDDICTHRMDCKKGPGHVDPKHPEVTQAPDTYTLEASTVFTDAHTYSPYWKRIQTI